jgi:Kazal-type serine protease inhibitor domain.
MNSQQIILILTTAIILIASINLTEASNGFVANFRREASVCRNKRCPVGHKCIEVGGDVDCICDHQCSQTKSTGPICADGVTYKNLCHLQMKICQEQRIILVQHYGECKSKLCVRV